TVGGVSNKWEGSVTPGAGDWRSVYFYQPTSSNSRLDHVIVRYGGTSENAGVYLKKSSPLVINSEISRSSAFGIRIDGSVAPQISSSVIRANGNYGISSNSSLSPEIHFNNILNNNKLGVQNANLSVPVNAQNNYWGDPSGPSGVGPGTGDAVTSGV